MSGSKKCRKELPMIAEITRNKRIKYFPFFNEISIFRLLKMASKISMVLPRGHTKPQKKRPKMSVPTTRKRDNRATVMIARNAILVTRRINGSKRRKMF